MTTFNFEDLIGPALLDSNGESVSSLAALQGKKYVMLYFSAHWCPSCRGYTPYLAAAYNAHKENLESSKKTDDKNNVKLGQEVANIAETEQIEVIFVSLDSVQKEYDNYRSTMPWLSIPFANLWKMDLKDKLAKKFGVVSIPTLIVLDGHSGEIVTRNGKGQYTNYFTGEYELQSSCVVS
mmetsp:Transcript_28508/g.59947  ORF Transcript_28508/g.59947 Transcript_28508/m.59947 type:complete len:180 (-) Transcript_28508:90-629(-)